MYRITDIDTLKTLGLTSAPMTRIGLEIIFTAYITNENDFDSWFTDMLNKNMIEEV